jgi:hypothetical protein
MASGAGAPEDRPPGDKPLGGKVLKDNGPPVVLGEISEEELLKHGIMVSPPRPCPGKKQTARKSPSPPATPTIPDDVNMCWELSPEGMSLGSPCSPCFHRENDSDASPCPFHDDEDSDMQWDSSPEPVISDDDSSSESEEVEVDNDDQEEQSPEPPPAAG